MGNKGLIYIFTGDGKGKTSAALGVAIRMLLVEKTVVWISWFKTKKWQISESNLPLFFKKNLKMYWGGEGFYIRSGETIKWGAKKVIKAMTKGSSVYDLASPANHKKAAQKALSLAFEVLKKKMPPDLLVLDELIQAVNEGLLTEDEVLRLIRMRGKTHLVITGHLALQKLVKEADLVTEMTKIKHPYDKGILAVKGLDF